MKVSIIGGGGRVGATTAYTLQLLGKVSEIALIDIASKQVEGEALDLRHGAALSSPQRFTWGGYEQLAGSDFVVVTAGLRRRPDESRLDLTARNLQLHRTILGEICKVGLPPDAKMIIVANPVDILTYVTVKDGCFPKERVIGIGTLLDSVRLRSFLGEWFGVAQTQVDALVLGEHGESMVPIWSAAAINGVPLSHYPGYDEEKVSALFEATKKGGSQVIALKGGAAYSVSLCTAHLINAIVMDSRRLLPVSTYQTGLYGISDICLSVPTIVGRTGVEGVVEIKLANEELATLQNSARVLRETLSHVGA